MSYKLKLRFRDVEESKAFESNCMFAWGFDASVLTRHMKGTVSLTFEEKSLIGPLVIFATQLPSFYEMELTENGAMTTNGNV